MGAGLLLLTSFLFFYRLGDRAMEQWDESRVAVNAVWILRTHDWLIMRADGAPEATSDPQLQVWQPDGDYPAPDTSRHGLVPRRVAEPDLWNTKPPLVPWLQALSLKAFGYSAWAVRFPSALAGWLTVCVLGLFGWKVLRQPMYGLLAALVLASIPAFVGPHVTRSGDYDALLVLWVTAYCLSFWSYLHTRRRGYLAAASVGLALALFTKCSAALLPLPALGLYILAMPRHRWAVRSPAVWLALALSFSPLLLYYALREQAAPGYLEATWYNDWTGRFHHLVSRVDFPREVYLQRLLTRDPDRTDDLFIWLYALLGSLLVLFTRPRALPAIVPYAALQAAVVLALLMLARTRFPWYGAQLYPLLALLAAAGLYAGWQLLARQSRLAGRLGTAALALLVAASATAVVRRGFRLATSDSPSALRYDVALQTLAAHRGQGGPLLILRENFNSALDFYLLTHPPMPRWQIGVVPYSAAQLSRLRPGSVVLLFSASHRQALDSLFVSRPVLDVQPGWLRRLEGRRPAISGAAIKP